MITVPVSIGFHNDRIVGTMTIDETKLPPTSDFCFAIGVLAKQIINNPNGRKVITDFELVEVSIVDNLEYKQYLEKEYNVK